MSKDEIVFTPIGIIRTPYKNTHEAPGRPSSGKEIATVEIFKEFETGLKDLDGFSHVILVFYLHLSEGYSLTTTTRDGNIRRGLFSTRSPRRPNPIAISVTRLISVCDNTLTIKGIDAIDGSPLLDIKPYIPPFKNANDVMLGWIPTKNIYDEGK